MFTKHMTFILMATFLLLSLLVGCSENGSTSEPETVGGYDLTADFGGFKVTSEAPGFGDEEILAMEGSEDADDPVALSPYVDSLESLPECDIYSLELLWGHLQLDSNETEVTDWSGSLTVERGAIIALRLIRFDAGDHIVRPRDTCTTLDWVSYTCPHYDGILVLVYDPDSDSYPTENSVTFTTPPYTRTFTMSELDSISEIVDVGNNQVSINGFKTVPLECPEGYMSGHWIRQGPFGDRGIFRGRWISADGYLLGHLKGIFGVRIDGSRILFGKWISLGGEFRGLLRGTWGYDPVVDAASGPRGWFDGRWYDAELVDRGGFGGHWVSVRPHWGNNPEVEKPGEGECQGRGHGFFHGHWFKVCE